MGGTGGKNKTQGFPSGTLLPLADGVTYIAIHKVCTQPYNILIYTEPHNFLKVGIFSV